VSELC